MTSNEKSNSYRASITESDAELAFNSIAEQIGNIEGAIFALDDSLTRTQKNALHIQMFQQVFRMCFSWLVLTAIKTEELWRRYGVLASPTTKDKMRAALKSISDRGMTDLRDKSVAHILDKDTKSPLSPQQIEEAFQRITQGQPLEFFHWLRHPDNPKADTLSRALRLFRADIQQQFPNVKITMPVSTYTTPAGDVQY